MLRRDTWPSLLENRNLPLTCVPDPPPSIAQCHDVGHLTPTFIRSRYQVSSITSGSLYISSRNHYRIGWQWVLSDWYCATGVESSRLLGLSAHNLMHLLIHTEMFWNSLDRKIELECASFNRPRAGDLEHGLRNSTLDGATGTQ